MALMNTPEAQAQISLLGTETGRAAAVGRIEDFEVGSGVYITTATVAIRDSIDMLNRIEKDGSRTEGEKHFMAQKVANAAIDVLQKQSQAITRRADMLMEQATNLAYTNMARLAPDSQQQSEIRAAIREKAKTAQGLAEISTWVRESPRIAATVVSSERVLMGLAQTPFDKLHDLALMIHAPEQMADLERGRALSELPERINRTIGRIQRTYFNAALAAKFARERVEI